MCAIWFVWVNQSTWDHLQFLPELKYGSLCLTVGRIIVENFSLFCRLLVSTLLADIVHSFFLYVVNQLFLNELHSDRTKVEIKYCYHSLKLLCNTSISQMFRHVKRKTIFVSETAMQYAFIDFLVHFLLDTLEDLFIFLITTVSFPYFCQLHSACNDTSKCWQWCCMLNVIMGCVKLWT